MRTNEVLQRERGAPGQYEGSQAQFADPRVFSAPDEYAITVNTGTPPDEPSLFDPRGVHGRPPFEVTLEDFHSDRL